MKFMMRFVFVAAVFFYSALCGDKKDKVKPPKPKNLFKDPSFYQINSLYLVNLGQKHRELNSSIVNMKRSFESLKRETSYILSAFTSGLNEFDNLNRKVIAFEQANQKYVTEVTNADKKLLKDNAKAMKKFTADQMYNLEDTFIAHEKKAAKERNDIKQMAKRLLDEMTDRKNYAFEIFARFESTQKTLEDLKPSFSFESVRMKEIVKEINLRQA
ncbi:uncharacterized protein LOC116343188 isoform X2 [Contarinia nasturtii]|uniref:uncharacterized protein LOC116343188 isoform X2 n=1 Tax=Contarinia nasturtii TaxID=265458 RepID=UPI0012D3C080|nr:uncharacterized protein LOC116343188 isoform X2 [Contarinia nasturtii]